MNTLGIITLSKREIWRFAKVWNQTVVGPIVTTLLFLAILTLAMGGSHSQTIDGIPYNHFVAPGLIMMAVVQNAFANTSSSLMISKIQGVIIDILMPPLTGTEITIAFVIGGLVRGFVVAVVVMASVYVFVQYPIAHPFLAFVFIMLSSMMLALVGIYAGLMAQTFEYISAITNYVVTPLAFLSGTFYSIKALPEFWYHICHFNPFFYMIDGFRYALIDYSDSDPMLGLAVLGGTNVALWLLVQTLLNRGYRLKS